MTQRPTARDRMLTSAIALFRERGIDATSFADVIERAEAPRGSIYHHFPGGKTQLAEEATRTAGALMETLIESSLARGGPSETLARLIGVFRRQLLDSDFQSGCPVAAGALESGDFAAAREIAGEAFTACEDAIAAALTLRGVPAARADSLATTAVTAIEGALLVARAQRSVRALDRVGAELTGMIASAVDEAER
ncbi:TetR/AcrR family transcriptional regulator [Rhodococcus sp. UNC363MFTsu5.1]|uniref:TetR/AcrR family transcriptional regulator n=1 Tax=Rhodococcus sp. UNC363MFTsu5.1 TaxID=1449069 RepID=UPI000489353A|nr:TetR/AcrR family transcriptional regulator [Rhodococcus sp. UNC363MFTsu5.1]